MRKILSTYRALLRLKKNIDGALRDKNLQPALQTSLMQLRKDLKAAESFWGEARKSKDRKFFQKRSFDKDKLQIGGGKCYLSDFVNLDIFSPADIIWDCRYGLPFHKNSFKFIFSEHFLEHLDFPTSVRKVLGEMYRVLKPGGEILLGVPDAGKVIEAYSSDNVKFLEEIKNLCYRNRRPAIEIYGNIDLVNYIFRDQLDNPKYSVHYWAYDKRSLSNLLRSIGFRNVKKMEFDRRYCNAERRLYTLYIKAVK